MSLSFIFAVFCIHNDLRMTKILVRNVKWLQFIGIVTTIDIYGAPDNNPNTKKLIAANIRIFRHAILAFVILVPQVFIIIGFFQLL